MKQDNEQFVAELMSGWCPTGPMSQVFIIEAIRRYAEQVAHAIPMPDSSILSGAAWKATGQHIHDLMTKRLDSSDDDEVTDSSSVGPRFLAVVDFDDCDNQYGMFCPSCGHSDEIDITANVDVRLTIDGTDADESADGSHNWDDDTPCSCANCGHSATVADFTPEEDDKDRAMDDDRFNDNADPMGATYCERCSNQLESGQIGLCDSCEDRATTEAYCAQGIHSWVNELGKLPPDTKCTCCGEPYGNPD